MVPLMYVLRHPVPTISQSLYDPADPQHVTLALEQAVGSPSVSQAATVIHAGGLSTLKSGDQLTGAELLALLCAARKVVTL